MKIKKVIFTILCLMLVVFLSGCASIEYGRVLNNEGEIVDAVSVKLDNEKISNAGYNITKVKNDIKTKMNYYLTLVVNNFYVRDDKLTALEKSAVMNNINYGVKENDDFIIASIKFKNITVFKYFYGLHLVEDKNDDEVIKEFLVTKSVSTGKTIFSTEDAKYITNDFLSYFNNNFTLDDANLSYVFGTYSDKVYSDATNTYYIDGINYHQWIIDDINKEITTFTMHANPINWYLLALGLTFVLIIILYVISLFKKSTKNNKPLSVYEISNEIKNLNKE